MRHRKLPRYGHNPPLLREIGPKVRDEVTGGMTYEGRLVVDEFGRRVDPRFGGYDWQNGRSDVERTN